MFIHNACLAFGQKLRQVHRKEADQQVDEAEKQRAQAGSAPATTSLPEVQKTWLFSTPTSCQMQLAVSTTARVSASEGADFDLCI